MTDTSGTPASSGTPARQDSPAADTVGETESARPKRERRWLRWAAFGTSVVLLGTAAAGWTLYQKLDRNIRTDSGTADELQKYAAERPAPVVQDAENILLIGSDDRGNGNGRYGRDSGTQRSDTAILLHLAADRKSSTAVSLPRDLMVDVPACRKQDGEEAEARFTQFNTAFAVGGAACTIRTVENLTGIRIDHHIIVDFTGFKRMVDAVGGVEVCLEEPIDDNAAHLQLPAGRQLLRGEDALGYVRARYSIGDGSDTERMGRQQEFLGALVKKMQTSGVLLNPARLYPLLDAATSSLTTDAGLSSLKELYDLVSGARDIPSDRVQFTTVPRQPYSANPNRDELVQPAASELFDNLRNDRPVNVAEEKGSTERTADEGGSGTRPSASRNDPAALSVDPRDRQDDPSGEPSGTPTPSYRGTTADDSTCG